MILAMTKVPVYFSCETWIKAPPHDLTKVYHCSSLLSGSSCSITKSELLKTVQ